VWLESDRLEEPLADILAVKSPAERKRQGEKRGKPKEGAND